MPALLRIGPVDDWVRTVAERLHCRPVSVGTTREELDPLLGEAVLLSCGVPGLNAVLSRLIRTGRVAEVPVGWVPDPDRASQELAGWLGLPARPVLAADVALAGPTRPVRLVRDDHGGVLLHRGRLSPWRGRTFGAQVWHDDHRAADGRLRWVEVAPDHRVDCGVVGRVAPAWRPAATSHGRSVQTACDDVRVSVDGMVRPRPVGRWTWYADPRQHWLLRTPS